MNSPSLHDLRAKYPESWLLEYIEKCKSGEILIGQELMLMLDILLMHLNEPTAIFPCGIRFELEDAHKRIKFIETHCKHYEAPFAGKPFILTLRQKAFVEALYSFKILDDELGRWVRLFQEALMVVARKCGKTPFVAALILAEWFCGEVGTKALCSSNDYEQADLMFQAINAMREESPTLEKVTRKNVKGLFFGNPKKPKKKGKFSYQNKGNVRKISAKTGAKEGKNIKVGAVDEAHELKDNSSVMPIRQALSTQDEPLYFEITTEGFTADGYLDERLKEARQALKGELERWRWLIWLHTQDSEAEVWQDEKTWVKSNPDLGVIKKWSFLRKMIEEAKTNMETRRFVLAKDFNIKQTDVAAWLQESDILNETAYNLEDFRGCVGLGGVDLSETTDLTCAKMLIMRPGDNKKYIITKYFIPQSKIDAGTIEDKKDYQKWVNDKLIEVSPGNENDFGLITKWYINLYKQYGIKPYKVGYDNALAKYWVKEMESCGFSMERVNQDKYTMSSPMRLLGDDMRSKLVVYNNNPVDKWCFENTAFQLDSSGRYIMPVKIRDNKNRRIDGCVTTIICYSMYTRYRAEYLSMVR